VQNAAFGPDQVARVTELSSLLSADRAALLRDERALLGDLQGTLVRLGAADADLARLAQSVRQLDELFLLVVVGEFNAGKSALVNVLIGRDVLPEGVTPTTAKITLVRFGDQLDTHVTPEGVAEVSAPVGLLRDLHVVDTPGTNAVLREHEAVTTEFVPRADVVLAVTSADRPFTETERVFLERVKAWGKKIVFVVNKIDILEGDAQVQEVLAFVRTNAEAMLGLAPTVFAVSVRAARGGRGDASAWEASGLAAVERFIVNTLDEGERVRLKLRNPLGIAQRAAEALRAELAARLDLLRDDRVTVEQIERQVAVYAADMTRDFDFRWADIEKVLLDMERRGHDHFDESIRLARIRDLLDRGKVKESFERKVVADAPQRVETKVHELIDWLVNADFQQWQSITHRLAERRAAHEQRLGHTVALGGFHQDRARLVESVGGEAQRVVQGYDRAKEAADIAEKARASVATSAALEVGAAGLGAVVAAVATTASADITGLAMAGVLATVGLLVIPHRRRQAKQELREKITAMRDRLQTSLRSAFEDELKRGIDRLRQNIEPYGRFVRAESEHLSSGRDALDAQLGRVKALAARIDGLP
jgi:small GTP-binding protein